MEAGAAGYDLDISDLLEDIVRTGAEYRIEHRSRIDPTFQAVVDRFSLFDCQPGSDKRHDQPFRLRQKELVVHQFS